MKKYLENTEGNSSKFWSIELNGQFLHIENGKIGGKAKLTKKDLKTPEKAFQAFYKEAIKKMQSGYVDPTVNAPTLKLEDSPFNDTTFEHDSRAEGIFYYAPKKLIVSGSGSSFYLWNEAGEQQDKYTISEVGGYFSGEYFFLEIPKSNNLLVYIKQSNRWNKIYLFDLSNEKLEFLLDKKIELSVEGYYGGIDADEKYIYFGYSNGFKLLDLELNTVKTIASPQKIEGSNGVAVNAKKKLIAFVEYGGDNLDKVLVVDLDGNKISEFEAKAHGGHGTNIIFNKEGTTLYTASSTRYNTQVDVWEVATGKPIKTLTNNSHSGSVMSMELSSDDKFLAIRLAGVDVMIWDLKEDAPHWIKGDQPLISKVCFANKDVMYQSFGNRIFPVAMKDGEQLLEPKGLTDRCRNIYFDNNRGQLWLSGGEKIICYDESGEIKLSTQAINFNTGRTSNKIILRKNNPAASWDTILNWVDLDSMEEIPLLTEAIDSLDFNDEMVITTSHFYSSKKKATRVWSHNGKMLKELNPKSDQNIYLYGADKYITCKDKKFQVWQFGEKSASLTVKKGHNGYIGEIASNQSGTHFCTFADNELKLWDGLSEEPIFFDFLVDNVLQVIAEDFLDVFLVLDEGGRIYTLDIKTVTLTQVACIESGISQACLTTNGLLYVATKALRVMSVDLSSILGIKKSNPSRAVKKEKVVVDLAPINTASKTTMLDFLKNLAWSKNMSDEEFVKIREALVQLEEKEGITKTHQFFTNKMLELGGQLKHEFAHEEENSSFAMSSDGKYLAVGTWVGDNYEEDGTLQIWELATGRCVNLLKGGYGGIGWPDYPFTVQWSPDNSFIGAAFNTNSVGKLSPFSSSSVMLTDACVTNGWSRPPAWCWLDNDALVVSCWHDSEIPACICKTNQRTCYEGNAKWFAKKIDASIKGDNKDFELQPFKWCQSTKDATLIYGYNNHNDVFAIDVEKKNLAWHKTISGPKAFSIVDDFFVYQAGGQFALANTLTGEDKDYIRATIVPIAFEFALGNSRFAAYDGSKLVIYDYKKEVATISLGSKLKSQYFSDTELRSVRFNLDGTQIACLLENGTVEIWDLAQAKLERTITAAGQGIYWGEQLVVVSSDNLLFIDNNGNVINECNKQAQVEAYNELYGEVPSPLEVGKKDLTSYFELQPLYPFKNKGKSEWLLATPSGLVVSSCKDIKELDRHLSYTWNNKFAWPFAWGADTLYQDMTAAKDDKKLPFNTKERALFKAAKKKKKRGIDFSQEGSVLDVIDVHQKSISNLSRGWSYHISKHNGAIAKKLVELGDYERAITVASNSPEWYVHVSNLGFVAIDLVKKGALDFAKKAYDRGVEVLFQEDKEKVRKGSLATFVYAPLAAAAHLLGDEKTGAEYFNAALVEIKEESNYFEKYAWLATCYLAIANFDEAMDVMKNGPWSGSWFTSYQVKFILTLLDLERLDLAMEYFDVAIEKCGKINEFDLLDGGFDALLELKQYDEAIVWMKRFPGLSTSSCEERLMNAFVKDNELERAKKYLLNILENNQWPDTIMENIQFMSFVDAAITREYLNKYKGPRPDKVYYKTEYYGRMAASRARVNMLDDALEMLAYTETDEERFYYLFNLATVPNENLALQIDFLEQAIALLDKFDDWDQNKIGRCLSVAKSARAINQVDKVDLLLDKAKEIAKNSSEDKRYTYTLIQDFYVEMDMLDEAYAMLKKQTPSNRKYMMKDFVLEVGKRGCWKAAAELLMTLSDSDLNDRPNAALSLVEKL